MIFPKMPNKPISAQHFTIKFSIFAGWGGNPPHKIAPTFLLPEMCILWKNGCNLNIHVPLWHIAQASSLQTTKPFHTHIIWDFECQASILPTIFTYGLSNTLSCG